MIKKLTEGYHPAYMSGWNDCLETVNEKEIKLTAENAKLREAAARLEALLEEKQQ